MLSLLPRRGDQLDLESVGSFLKVPKTAKEFLAVMKMLRPALAEERLSAAVFGKLAPIVADEWAKEETLGPFTVVMKRLPAGWHDEPCYREDGRWRCDVAVVEETSVALYRYVMLADGRMGRSRQLAIEGQPRLPAEWPLPQAYRDADYRYRCSVVALKRIVKHLVASERADVTPSP
jgi:hypothetical protein